MFKRRQGRCEMAFGKVPAYCKYELYMERYRHPAEFVAERLNSLEADKALDIGCGSGRLKIFFDDTRHMEWHGIEMSEPMIDICSSIGYKMHKHDLEEESLPFNDGEFSLVAGLHVLEHLKHPERAVREMGRVLNSGGLLVLGVPTKPPILAKAIDVYYSVRQAIKPKFSRTCNSYSASSFRRMVKSSLGSQFRIVDCRGFRCFSARKKLPLENYKWFYKISTWLGRAIPSITPEVNVIVEKLPSQ